MVANGRRIRGEAFMQGNAYLVEEKFAEIVGVMRRPRCRSRSGAVGCPLDGEHRCVTLFSTTGRRRHTGLASASNKIIFSFSSLLKADAAGAEASMTAKETPDARLGDA